MAVELSCPHCGQRLLVSDVAPQALTCPNCLGRLHNPHGRDPDIPIPVIPLERQVDSDTRVSSAAIGMIVFLACGGIGTVLAGATQEPGVLVLILFLGGIAGLIVGIIVHTFRRRTTAVEPAGYGQATSPVLPYQSRRQVAASESASVLAFFGGFMMSLGVCAGGFFLLAVTAGNSGKNGNLIYLLLVVASVVAVTVMAVRWNERFRGIGPGATVGLILGMLALGPCGMCYLMMALG